ncbi:hypothetical protein ACIBH1_45700 [Nonomuraea sp. NPDC050663]|uniref:hypothetical protein n=1 Tax=Nonomuraea sp. NPDC050663 TaxID=3364370 RepID=UPI0037B79D70
MHIVIATGKPHRCDKPLLGSSFTAVVEAHSREGLEAEAMRQAADFFGDSVTLWLNPCYTARRSTSANFRYRAAIVVRELLPSTTGQEVPGGQG